MISWGTQIFRLNFMGYEKYFGILKFHSASAPAIKNDRSLSSSQEYLEDLTLFYYKRRAPRNFRGQGRFSEKGHNLEYENKSMQKFEKSIFRS